jgi:hypothetical protein
VVVSLRWIERGLCACSDDGGVASDGGPDLFYCATENDVARAEALLKAGVNPDVLVRYVSMSVVVFPVVFAGVTCVPPSLLADRVVMVSPPCTKLATVAALTL